MPDRSPLQPRDQLLVEVPKQAVSISDFPRTGPPVLPKPSTEKRLVKVR
jgi:hypothetical protein